MCNFKWLVAKSLSVWISSAFRAQLRLMRSYIESINYHNLTGKFFLWNSGKKITGWNDWLCNGINQTCQGSKGKYQQQHIQHIEESVLLNFLVFVKNV